MWDYDVTVDRIRYEVTIADDHSVQSVSRIVPIEGTNRTARKCIWHKVMRDMRREASKAIRAARAVERRYMDAETLACAKVEADKEFAEALKKQEVR